MSRKKNMEMHSVNIEAMEEIIKAKYMWYTIAKL